MKKLKVILLVIIATLGLIYCIIIKFYEQFDQLISNGIIQTRIHPHFNFTECKSIFEMSENHFLTPPELKQKLRFKYPTYLFSHGGSGNTLTRLIIEEITSIWTGSPYHDRELLAIGFQGELYCKKPNQVIAIKYHPENLKLKMNNISNFFKPCFHTESDKTWDSFSAIFIIRDPWESTFSEFQFSKHRKDFFNNGTGISKHVAHFELKYFKIAVFRRFVIDSLTAWLWTFELMDIMQRHNMTNYIVIEYKRLINLNRPRIALNEMNKMIQFLYRNEYYQEMKDILHIKMQCIIDHLMPMNYQRFGIIHRPKGNASIHLTRNYAYQKLDEYDAGFICNEWDRIKQAAMTYNFSVPNGINCSNKTYEELMRSRRW